MPELPEVETIVRRFRPLLLGRRIVGFESRWPKNCLPAPRRMRNLVCGRAVVDVSRRAKFILLHLDCGGWVLVHLRMSGRFEWALPGASEPGHVRAVWSFDGGQRLLFCDARKFGRIVHTADFAVVTASLGPEPLDPAFTAKRLARILESRSRQIKPLLLDQTAVSGLGNIYADEALFRAGIHPATPSNTIVAEQVERLHRAIRQVLREGIRRNGTTIDWIYPSGQMQDYLRVYGRTGLPCPRCGAPIVALRIAQRGTHICPECQPARGRGRTAAALCQ